MIQLENITKRFPHTLSLRDVCLDIPDGEFLCIMGPSGSGKTTLLNIIGLLDAPTDGRYLLDEVDVYAQSEAARATLRRRHLGFVFQSFNLIDELTVWENVELPLKLLGYSRSERRPRVEELLRRLGISHRAQMYPAELSGGQQQRVALARAVINHPRLLLADEPTGNLDSKQGQEVMQLLSDLHHDLHCTIVMVTHSHRAAAHAERVVELFDGRLLGVRSCFIEN